MGDLIVKEVPSHEFCKKCKNSETRIIKDSMNSYYVTLTALADEIGIEYNAPTELTKGLTDWIKEQVYSR